MRLKLIDRIVLVLLLFALCSSSFCLFLHNVFGNLRIFSVLIPLLTVLFIGICPVFFDFRALSHIQMLFPPTYYVNAIYDPKYLGYMVLYSAALIALSFGVKAVKRLIKTHQIRFS